MDDKVEKKENIYKKCLTDENYKYWRKVQREQLGISANLYFIFSSAIFGFTLNFLIDKKNEYLCLCQKFPLIISLIPLLISIFYFAKFTDNRLKDFKETSKLFSLCKNEEEVLSETDKTGKLTWEYYNTQVKFLKFGFSFSLIGFFMYIIF